MKNPANNAFLLVSQFSVAGASYTCHPDLAGFVNGLPDSEIEAGNRLGMKTIQILRPGVPPSDRATRHIRGLRELKELL